MNQYFWDDMSPTDLERVQKSLAPKISQQSESNDPQIIVGYDSIRCRNEFIGSLVYFNYQDGRIIERQTQLLKPKFDVQYQSGYLALYEMPIFLELWNNRPFEPDIVVIDGNGIFHPNWCGFASHLSFIIDRPTFGIAKNLLGGTYEELQLIRGNSRPIRYREQVAGQAICTRTGAKPVYVSVGNRIDLETCIDLTLRFANYRIPELTRQPDIIVRQKCRELKETKQ